MAGESGANYYDVKAAYEANSGEYEDPDEDEDGDEMEFRRFEWFWEGRNSTGDPLTAGLLGNYQVKLSSYFSDPVCTSNVNTVPWSNVGPDRDATKQRMGKVQSILFDPTNDPPQLIYGGTTHSGLWKSTDGGITWQNITDSYHRPLLGVHSILRLTDVSPTRLVIGTGRNAVDNFSMGVLWSNDEGANWHQAVGIPASAGSGPVVDLKSYGAEVVAVQGQHIWRSTDHGENFTEITPAVANVIFGNPPDNTNRFNGVGHYLGGGGDGVLVVTAREFEDANLDGADIYASEDLGVHWTRITAQLPLLNGDLVRVSQVSVVNDPGGTFDGFHIMARTKGDNNLVKAHLFSGQSIGSIALHQIFQTTGCDYPLIQSFGLGYDQFSISKFGRVFTSGVYSVFESDIGSGGCGDVPLGYDRYYLRPAPQIPYWPMAHDDVRAFFIADGATAGQERIAIGHDGGMAYRSTDGTWHDWNGPSFPTSMIYSIGLDEFHTRMIAGAQDDENWDWLMDPLPWGAIYSHTDGGSANVFKSKDLSIDLRGYTQNSSRYFKGSYLGNNVNQSHTADGCCFRLYWPSLISVNSGEPRMYMVSADNITGDPVGPPGLFQLDPAHNGASALNLTPGPERNRMYDAHGLAMHPQNDNVIFVGIGGHYWGPGDLDYRLFRTTNHGTNWTDLSTLLIHPGITPDENVFARFGVNVLEIDPDSDPNDIDHMTVYAGMDGIPDDDGFERVFKSTDGGMTWTDMSDGLPGFMVNDLKCQPGSGGILYAATDIGVYVYDPALGYWQCFNSGLPVCIVSSLQVNTCSGQLYAATWGRSIYRTGLYQPQTITTRVIDQNLTIGDLVSSQHIRVTAGHTLTITGTVQFLPMRKLIVEQHARLVVDGGTLTNRCEERWAGVELWGSSTEDQSGGLLPNHQGKVWLKNGALIENANYGIITCARDMWGVLDMATTGGIVYIDHSTVKNCGLGVLILPWPDPVGGLSINTMNKSKFSHSDFIVDSDYPGTDIFWNHVTLWRVNNVIFTNCHFKNLRPDAEVAGTDDLGDGIFSLDSRFTVQDYCPGPWLEPGHVCYVATQRSSFEGLDHGIDAGVFSTTRNFTVTKADFLNNVCGVYAHGVVGPVVMNNEFTMGARGLPMTGVVDEAFDDLHRAVFTTNSYGTRIDDNTIGMDANAQAQAEGVVVGFSRDHNDLVFRNHAFDLVNGFVGEGIDADPDNQTHVGLWWLCNENLGNDHDLYSRVPPGITDPTILVEHTVRLVQGANNRPADNTFDRLAPTPAQGDFKSDNDQNVINYMYRDDVGAPQYNPIGLTLQYVAKTPALAIPAGNCSRRVLITHVIGDHVLGTKSAGYGVLSSEKLAYGSTRYLYDQLIDGGSTDEVVEEITESWPEDAWNLRSYLLSKSPYLSFTALKEAVTRNIMPQPMLTEVLVANPEATQRGGFLRWLQDQSPYPLPTYLADLVVASWNVRTYRSALEITMADHHANMTMAADLLVQAYRSDTVYDPEDSIVFVWQQVRTKAARYAEALTDMQQGDLISARAVVEGIPAEHDLKDPEEQERQRMLALIDFLTGVYGHGRSEAELTPQEVTALEAIVQGAYDRPATWAQNLLCFGYQHCRAPLTGGSGRELRSYHVTGGDQAVGGEEHLWALPNPASQFTEIHFELQDRPTSARILIHDITGRVLQTFEVRTDRGSVLWDTRAVDAGTYTAELIGTSHKPLATRIVVDR